MNISLQLYSIKEEEEESFERALEMTAKAGYRSVEFAGYFGNDTEAMKKLLLKYDLTAVSTHIGIEQFTNRFEEELQYAINVGYDMIVCPWLDCDSVEEIKQAAAILEKCALAAVKRGIKVGYHNHDQEFKKFDGKYALDILLELAPTVMLEPDLFWIAYAGLDPVEYITPYAKSGRICAIHAKEISENLKENIYIGSGIIDFKGVAALVDPEKIPYIVEQEEYTSDHFDGISKSFKGLQKVLCS
ncbi:MAG: sugar phosphate isomerase/epimerase family protein [Ruminiclostridium sp.]